MEVEFCVEALKEALETYGKQEIFNSDQVSQFASLELIKVLADREVNISMDGKGAWRDNVFVERLWRSVKYLEVYLRASDSVPDARASPGRYLVFCNERRPHLTLEGRASDEADFGKHETARAA